MLTTCVEPGCETLVMGGRCIEHERPQTRVFVRGRPFASSVITNATPQPVLGTIRFAQSARVPTLTGTPTSF